MEISGLLAYYKSQIALDLVLEAFNKQTLGGFEIIIAEDDNNHDTKRFLESKESKLDFPILHLNQEKKTGFRKSEMLNRGIRIARGKTLVFIDGDCIPTSIS